MTNDFTQKEMMVIMMNKLDKIDEKLNETHEIAVKTNGKVKLHTKLIFGLGGIVSTIIAWIISKVIR